MNNKVNYTLVGLIVLLGVILILSFTYWLLKPKAEDETQNYLIYFNESVVGLNVNSAVKYRGIDIGKVTKLSINPKNTEQVEVLITILKSTPIKETTVAKLTSQGITGLSYINLSLGDNGAARLVAKKGEKYPVIKAEASFFERFEKSLGNVSVTLSEALHKTERLLNDENQEQISLLLKRSASFMSNMDKTFNDEAIADFHTSLHNLSNITKKVDSMMPKLEKFIDNSSVLEDKISMTLASVMESFLSVKTTMDKVKQAVENGDFNIKDISKNVVPTMNNTLLEMQNLMIKMEKSLNQYERSPSDLIFKKEAIKKGPGEK